MVIRELKPTDFDYISKSVVDSFLNNSREAQKVNKEAYKRSHWDIVQGLLANAKTLVLCDEQDNDLIYGFVIYDHFPLSDVLHYFYLRNDFRGKGFAKKLILCIKKNEVLAYSHLTDGFRPARLKELWGKVMYDPYLRSMAFKKAKV